MKNKDSFKIEKSEIRRFSGIKNTLKAIKLAKYKKSLMFQLILTFSLLTILSICEAYFSSEFITYLTAGNLNKFLQIGIIIFAIGIITTLTRWYSSLVNERFAAYTNIQMRIALMSRILNLKTENLDKNSSGTFVARIHDAVSVGDIILTFFSYVEEMIRTFSYIVILLIRTPLLSVVYIVVQLILFIVKNRILPKRAVLQKKNMDENRDKAETIEIESIHGGRDVKSLNIKDVMLEKYKEKRIKFTERGREIQNWFMGKITITRLIEDFCLLALVVLGYFLTKNNYITLAGLIFYVIYKPNVKRFFGLVYSVKDRLAQVEVGARRVTELFDEEKFPSESFGNVEKTLTGNINIKGVSFSYDEEKQVFKNLNLKIKPNRVTAIVGKSGGGKSTILSLISKFYNTEKGDIIIDGVKIQDLTENSLRGSITYIQQSPYIFNMSFRENLQLVKPDVTEEEMEDVCKRAEILDVINENESRFDTIIGENGITLSGGQKQRFAIARALLTGGKIIMFDESTSALDNISQAKIQQTIDNLAKDHTIIVVAHRLSTIINADEIIMVDSGKVLAKGTHNELMQSCEKYRELYEVEES